MQIFSLYTKHKFPETKLDPRLINYSQTVQRSQIFWLKVNTFNWKTPGRFARNVTRPDISWSFWCIAVKREEADVRLYIHYTYTIQIAHSVFVLFFKIAQTHTKN